MSTCEILVEASIEAAASPAMPWYICKYVGRSGIFGAAACITSTSYNRLLGDPAFKAVNKEAASKGCTVAVQAGEKVYRIVIVKGKKTIQDIEQAVKPAKKTFQFFNTAHGMQQLMRYLTAM